MRYHNAIDPLDHITIDYAGFHGPVASALVADNDDLWSPPNIFRYEIVLDNDCESDWHDDTCECMTERELKEHALDLFGRKRLAIMEAEEY
jgi:hypothetical protein